MPTLPISKPNAAVESMLLDIYRQLGFDPNRPPIHIEESLAAEVLDTTPGTLCTWRSTGRHRIPFVKIGRNVRYPLRGLAEYMVQRTYVQVGAKAGA